MLNAAEAYGQTAKMAPADPREREANLLMKSATQLQQVKDNWAKGREDLSAALLYNRKLWTIFASSAADDDHPLPREIKQNIANLALYIFKRTTEIQARPAPEKLTVLININREVASGLFGRA